MPLYPPLLPTVWLSFPVVSNSLITKKILWGLSKVDYLPPYSAAMPLSWDRPLRSPSCLHTLQISVTKWPTAPRLTIVSLCGSSPTAFLPLPALLPPWASPISHPLEVALVSPWSVVEIMCVFLINSAAFLPKVSKSQLKKIGPLIPPPYRKLWTPWVLPHPLSTVSQISPIPTLRA